MAYYACDMIANLTKLPPVPELPEGVQIKRAMGPDRQRILQFVDKNFSDAWYGEVDIATSCTPSRCLIAVKDQQLVGIACWDIAAKGFFGPIGVDESVRGLGIGKALLIRTMEMMREEGYGYAIIGWVDSAMSFYEKVLDAKLIPGGEPWNSVFTNMIERRWERAMQANAE